MTAPSTPAGYDAAREGAAVFSLPGEAILAVEGRDTARFLHGQCSADIAALPDGEGRRGYVLDAKAHPFGECFILRDGENYFLTGWEPAPGALLRRLDRYLLGDRCALRDLAAARALFHLAGPRAAAVAAALPAGEARRWPRRRTAREGFDLLVPRAALAEWRGQVVAAGAVEGSVETLDLLRVEAGIPRGAGEADENTILPEWSQPDAVSHSKGCYIGQETMERVRSRGAARRRLAGVIFSSGLPAPGLLRAGNAEAGALFQPVASPRFGTIALALVRVAVPDGARVERDGVEGIVAKLPFEKSSGG